MGYVQVIDGDVHLKPIFRPISFSLRPLKGKRNIAG